MKISENQNIIFTKGEKASPDYFTGTAWVNILVPQDETGNYTVGDVVFEPGCRNNWHTHPAGQILLVTSGYGYYQERGKSAKSLTKGDVVDYLVSSQKVTQNQIRKIKLLRKHTFAVVPTAQAQDIITALYGLPLNGRKIRISITNEVPQLNDFDRSGSSDRPFRRRSSEGRGSESRGGGSFNRGGGRSRSNSYSSSHAQY